MRGGDLDFLPWLSFRRNYVEKALPPIPMLFWRVASMPGSRMMFLMLAGEAADAYSPLLKSIDLRYGPA